MKNAKSVWISLICLVLVFSTLLPGCSKPTSSSSDVSSAPPQSSAGAKNPAEEELAKGKVNLILYLVGDAVADQQIVYEEVNKKLETDMNTTLTVKNVPWTDFMTKYQLIFSSGENFDMAYTGDFVNYAGLANKNAFMELSEDDIKTYAPKTWEDLNANQSLLKGSKVNNKIYMVPAKEDDVRGSVVAVRGDLMKKYNIPEIKTVEDYYNYLTTIAKNEKQIIAFSNDPSNTSWFDETYNRYNGISYIGIEGNNVNNFDANPKVYNKFETDSFLQYALKMRELNQAGVFPRDLLSSKNLCNDMFEAGTCSAVMGMYSMPFGVMVKANKANPSWDVRAYDITNYNTSLVGQSPSDAGIVLNPKTKNKARCLMVIDKLRGEQDYQDLTLGGIEGTHYSLDASGKYIETDRGIKSYPYNADCSWGWVNASLYRTDANLPQSQIDAKAKWKGIYKDSVIISFKFDDTKVKTQEAAISNTLAKHLNIILYGFASDPTAEIKKMNEELYANGLADVQKETQAQLDAYVKQYNS